MSDKERIKKLEKTIEQLKRQHAFELQDMESAIRGKLNGEFSHWIDTALDASTAEPPVNRVIKDRLQRISGFVGNQDYIPSREGR